MPSIPKPKTWRAARSFRYRRGYKAGEPVTDRRTIEHLLQYGNRFIVADRTKPAPAETTADPDVDTATSSEEG